MPSFRRGHRRSRWGALVVVALWSRRSRSSRALEWWSEQDRSGRHSRRAGVARAELASEGRKTLKLNGSRVLGAAAEGTKFRGYRWFMGLGGA